MVVANINRNIIVADAERYANALKSGGRLLVSGFLTEDISAIEERIEALGFKRLQMLNDEGWVAISFEKL
jgi:ribosomal protein L11 methyltransferase